MKQKIQKMAFYVALAMLPLFISCSNDDDGNNNGYGDIGPFVAIKLSVLNASGDDLLKDLKVYPVREEPFQDWDYVGLYPGTYAMDVYLDGQWIKTLDNTKTGCSIDKNPMGTENKCLFLHSSEVQQLMINNNEFGKKHTIEFHFTCEALFKDKEAHIIRFEYDPIDPSRPAGGFKAPVYFDGQKLESVYPEWYGVQPSYVAAGALHPVVTLTLGE